MKVVRSRAALGQLYWYIACVLIQILANNQASNLHQSAPIDSHHIHANMEGEGHIFCSEEQSVAHLHFILANYLHKFALKPSRIRILSTGLQAWHHCL